MMKKTNQSNIGPYSSVEIRDRIEKSKRRGWDILLLLGVGARDSDISFLLCEPRVERLKILDLRDNHLSALPPEIGKLTALTQLWLSNNLISSLPPEMVHLTKLNYLDLNNNQLSAVPPVVGDLTALEYLYLNNNNISTLPPELGQLANLMRLDIDSNQLSSLPPELGGLTSLVTLSIANNKLSELPSELGQTTNLEFLILRDNQLKSLPNALGSLIRLQELNIRANSMKVLPSVVFRLKALKKLVAAANGISDLPTQIQALQELEYLDLSHNKLSSLPAEIGRLNNLSYLDIGANRLSSLPSEIGSVHNLTELRAGGNKLSSLPDGLFQLTEITDLWLNGNKFRVLPKNILNLVKLKVLYLRDNIFLGIPDEILGNRWEDVRDNNAAPPDARPILEYYFRKHHPDTVFPWSREGHEGTESASDASPDSPDKPEAYPKAVHVPGHPIFSNPMPSADDRLGREQLVNVLAKIIEDAGQQTPQTIAIFAPWGAGKSSVIEQLRRRLDQDYRKRIEGEDIEKKKNDDTGLSKWGAPRSWPSKCVGMLKDWLQSVVDERVDSALLNAWQYEHTGNLAAALAQEVAHGIMARYRWYSPGYYWTYAHYIVKRLSWVIVKEFVFLATVIAIVLRLFRILPPFTIPGTNLLSENIPLCALFLVALIYVFPKAKERLPHVLATGLGPHLKSFQYDKELGQLPVIREDIKILCSIRLGNPRHLRVFDKLSDKLHLHNNQKGRPRRLVVFVDDLDRCGDNCLVQTLGALRLVLDLKNVFVVIGIDPHIALTVVAKKYAPVESDGRTPADIARDYLGKIIQIPITLRDASQEELESYVQQVLFIDSDKAATDFDWGYMRNCAESFAASSPAATEKQHVQTSDATDDQTRKQNGTAQNTEGRSSEEIHPGEPPPTGDQENEPTPTTQSPETERTEALAVMKHDDMEIQWFYFLQCAFKFNNPRQIMRLKDSYSLLKALLYQKGKWISGRGDTDRTKRYEILRMLFYLEFLNSIPFKCRGNVTNLVEENTAPDDLCKCLQEARQGEMKFWCGRLADIKTIMYASLETPEPWKDLAPTTHIDHGLFEEMRECVKQVVLPACGSQKRIEDANEIESPSDHT